MALATDNCRIYKNTTVFDETLRRIRWVFDEFPNVVVASSGGKDSTIVFQMSMMVARELDRLPLTVMWIDQEAEWQATVDEFTRVMYDPDVNPRWYQMPIKIFNATSTVDHWLNCWHPDERDVWMRDQDPCAVTENVYGTDRFSKLFDNIIGVEYDGQKAAIIGGVRSEESPIRDATLTNQARYKGETWLKSLGPKSQDHYTFYPIYDWSYTDVWKAIHDNEWHYNKVYDYQYQYGIPVLEMRVSNLHHETAVKNLFYLQEAEPQTYERLVNRVAGIDMAGKMGTDDYFVNELPFMFTDWREYRDYLLDNLIDNPVWRAGFEKRFASHEKKYFHVYGDKLFIRHVNAILVNDWESVRLGHLDNQPTQVGIRRRNKLEQARDDKRSNT